MRKDCDMKTQKDVEIFMNACGQQVKLTTDRQLDNKEPQVALYMKLIQEEFNETLEAFANNDMVELADGLADLQWVIHGLASTVGIDMQPVWDEVKASNMSKTVDGSVIKREDGKILKPDTFFEPNISRALYGE